ncbi:MAG: DUF1015 domain-containing protein [Ruminococcaceae bacterium]|nr:DUF1015 domain-containing protein [Oscillospiraceae bacterium]
MKEKKLSEKAVCFGGADILLPDFNKYNGTKWATIACDQFTSEREYWEAAAEIVGDVPSTLALMIPEVYLSETAKRIPSVHKAMKEYLADVLYEHKDAMIYLERVQSDGRVRRGLIGAVDLEGYDYNKGAQSPIRATEGTVIERIPPRVAVRRDAELELPHVMLLIDDSEKTVIEPLAKKVGEMKTAYDFDLMLGGGHVKGYFVDKDDREKIYSALEKLSSADSMTEKYGNAAIAPLLFAVGDGNHSLASAKAAYEEVKSKIGVEAAATHPSRYALCEVVNLHDEALDFEPIYRVVFGADADELIASLKKYAAELSGNGQAQRVKCIIGDKEEEILFADPVQQLTVGTLQSFLDDYAKSHEKTEIDYIHGEDSLRALASKDDVVGFLFDGMSKDELFRTVIFDGALPRKTFSMGHARDKRYYLECRKIK